MSDVKVNPVVGGCLVIFVGLFSLVMSVSMALGDVDNGTVIFIFIFSVILCFSGFYGLINAPTSDPPSSSPPPSPPRPSPPRPIPIPDTRIDLTVYQFQGLVQNQLNSLEERAVKIHWVEDEHRTHPWSKRPGGCTVVVIYSNGHCRGYDRVKRPHRYLNKVSQDYISNFMSDQRIDTLDKYIEKFYAAREGAVRISLVWSKRDGISPWSALERYATE